MASLVETLKAKAAEAMKKRDAVATSILRLALGEIQTAEARSNKAATDDEAAAVVRKLIKSNEETLAVAESADQTKTLEQEVAILRALLPASLTPAQIAEKLAPVADAIRAAAGDGPATGIAMKHLKSAGITAPGADVAAAVKSLRGA